MKIMVKLTILKELKNSSVEKRKNIQIYLYKSVK